MSNEDEPFLKRWSRRKLESKDGTASEEHDSATPVDAAHDQGRTAQEQQATKEVPAPAGKRELTEADFTDVDFDALNAQSDYSRFLQPGVPEAVKYKALRKLWASDPIFNQIDPFQDYAGDFTDEALAVPSGTLKTAYRIGRGFLSDEEVAEWEKLGRPEKEQVAEAKPAASTVGARVQVEACDQPEVHALLRQLDAHLASLYPGIGSHGEDVALLASNARLVVAREGGSAVGCGALVLGENGEAEIRGLFVAAEARGRKIGRSILTALEAAAKAADVRVIRLEMGRRQPEALSLCRSQGYRERGPFGGRINGPLSLFMEKWLS